jgi:hypothetical protein
MLIAMEPSSGGQAHLIIANDSTPQNWAYFTVIRETEATSATGQGEDFRVLFVAAHESGFDAVDGSSTGT